MKTLKKERGLLGKMMIKVKNKSKGDFQNERD